MGCRKGTKFSEEHKRKIALAKLGERNPMWRGDKVGLYQLHDWVRVRKDKPEFCQLCQTLPPNDLANISGKYLRDLSDWIYLCRHCHMVSDGRINNLKQYNGKKIEFR